MEISIQNRQRRYKVKLTNMKTMAEELALGVFCNLKKRKPKWKRHLSFIEENSILNLLIVSPLTIRRLNKEWLHKDKTTDVLSFPLLDVTNTDELAKIKAFSHSGKQVHQRNVHQDYRFELGEIFISYEQAIKQAEEYNHSLERELAFLFVHGLLHILGFDHQTKTDEEEMFGRQKEILVKAGYVRR